MLNGLRLLEKYNLKRCITDNNTTNIFSPIPGSLRLIPSSRLSSQPMTCICTSSLSKSPSLTEFKNNTELFISYTKAGCSPLKMNDMTVNFFIYFLSCLYIGQKNSDPTFHHRMLLYLVVTKNIAHPTWTESDSRSLWFFFFSFSALYISPRSRQSCSNREVLRCGKEPWL